MKAATSPYRVASGPQANDLDGHLAVVTGGNSGIGLGIARGLAAAGARVAVLGRRGAANAAAVADLEGIAPGRAVSYVCDVGDEEQVVATFAPFAPSSDPSARRLPLRGSPALAAHSSISPWRSGGRSCK
jgi:NAD(P)-dependent dehydrogenase (short-subunit alcohol dehydrogenase family)